MKKENCKDHDFSEPCYATFSYEHKYIIAIFKCSKCEYKVRKDFALSQVEEDFKE